jgi:hypothetical protein
MEQAFRGKDADELESYWGREEIQLQEVGSGAARV